MKEKIYLITAFKSLVEGKKYDKIDLGNYELEFLASEQERCPAWLDGMEPGIPSLCIQVKIRNKKNNKIEFAETFYKSLNKNKFDEVYNLTLEEKLIFICKKENFVTGKKYAKSRFSVSNNFYRELDHFVDGFGSTNIEMPKTLTTEAKRNIIIYYENLLNGVEQKSKINNFPKHK